MESWQILDCPTGRDPQAILSLDWRVIMFYRGTRGPWTAMPALIEVKQQTKLIDIFTCAKNLFKTGVILWENT